MTPVYPICISEDLTSALGTEVFSVLERLLPVRFIFKETHGVEAAGEMIVNNMSNQDKAVRSKSVPSLGVPLSTHPANEAHHIEFEVNFADDPDVPFPFRGRMVKTKVAGDWPLLSLRENEKVLATIQQKPIWIMSVTGMAKHFRSALPLPRISADQNFSDVFNGERFLEILPFLYFLREICESRAYQNSPLRAAYIIDDPNLHWPRYGFVDYREIAAHAKKENYHVSFATIPIDTWFTHRATADLFRLNSRWLSLLIHGNNHAKNELAQNYSEEVRKALLRQAIQRIERLEQKAKFRVCRVMVPPHGACSDKMLAELPKCGFESACISAKSLRVHNQSKAWTKTLGFFPSETIEGCPVLPRWGLTGNVKNTLLVAAYLGQPMILRGHHQDLKDGMEVFDEFAKFINGLGNVFWSNMTDLSRLNYLWRMEGTACRVKLLGTKIAFVPPSQATTVILEGFGAAIDYSAWQAVSAEGSIQTIVTGEPLFLAEQMRCEISIERAPSPEQPASARGRLKSISAGFIARRFLTEARDRFFTF